MSRRKFLKNSAVTAGGIMLGSAQAQLKAASADPIKIIATGYGPATTSFSLALKRIGDRIEAKFPGEVQFHYVYNILELGYKGSDILWLAEKGVTTFGYQSSSYLTSRVPDLGIVDLPFIFPDNETARRSMDGGLGKALTSSIEANTDYKILGYFENGFRHISNRIRPVRTPTDLKDISLRVLPSETHRRTFELLGANAQIMDLSEAIARVKALTIDAQENPFANTVTYGVHNIHKFHTMSKHFYISRPIFFNRAAFESWPIELQTEMQAAVTDAVAIQRSMKDQEELDAAEKIRESGGEIIQLTAEETALFKEAVKPIYAEVRDQYSPELRKLAGLP
ncbi:MAG: TRAP transporter substrate-binding protein [Acidiferrobacterales bacterium]|nr:TRAP transporter substrate-binding protein [Acidiferrobacterales bacterium]